MADKAFLNGINNYKHISDLRGCENDVDQLRELLLKHFGFSSNNIRTRKNERVTKAEIKSGWAWLLKGAKPGDRLVFHFSGHGSYTADADGDEEDDRRDELLCLYDMDWDDPDSYLLDDELWEMTQELPEGVLLTVLLDCCHSGTGTRVLVPRSQVRAAGFSSEKLPLEIVQDTLARAGGGEAGVRALALADEEDEHTVLARFVEPPPEIRERADKAKVRAAFFSGEVRGERGQKEMNHVLLAGCQNDQTSADAHLDNTFRGAFTHGFCAAVREHGPDVDHQTLIRQVRNWMKQKRFSQVPQLEPEKTQGPLFQFRAGEAGPAKPARENPAGTPSKDDLLIQLMQELLAIFRKGELRSPAVERGAVRHLVYVHGICEHLAGYSEPWWAALKPHLSPGLAGHLERHRQEVVWSNIVNDRAVMAAESFDDEARTRQVAEEIKAVLHDRSSRMMLEGISPAERGMVPEAASLEAMPRATFGIPGLECADDFAKYLTQPQTRRRIIDRFLSVIRPRLDEGGLVDVISHSWGTVVAYEGLRELDDSLLAGRVLNFFTVGSALSIWPVKKMLKESYQDGRKPRHVLRWINLDAQCDAVGGPLVGNPFQVDQDFVGLYPVGCEEFGVWRAKWFSPACAHSSYFHADNDAVNRGIFARFINQTA